MILYHVVTMYQLESCMVHKLRYNNSQKADILVSSDFPDELVEKLSESRELFDKVGVIHNGGIKLTTKNQAAMYIMDNLELYEKIYVGGYHYGFGKTLVDKQIHFSVFEEACGVMCKPERLAGIVERLSKDWFDCVNSMGLIDASNQFIDEKICSIKHQSEEYYDEKAVDFDLATEIGRLSIEHIELLKSFFGAPENIFIPEKSALILTQHFANLTIMTWDEQKLLYTLLVDYFLEDYYLIFKTHPFDLMYYDELFEGCLVIRERFPSELLPYIFNRKPDLVATINSTAIWGIDSIINKSLSFDICFETEFMKLHKYYVAMEYGFQMMTDNFHLYSFGANESVINNFSTANNLGFDKCQSLEYSEICNINENALILIDNICFEYFDEFIDILDSLSDKVICIFLGIMPINKKTDFLDQVHPVCISICENNKDVIEEKIFIYSKGDLSKMSTINKTLSNSNIQIIAEEQENDKRQIKVLEGILEATEKRLLYYIEKENGKR